MARRNNQIHEIGTCELWEQANEAGYSQADAFIVLLQKQNGLLDIQLRDRETQKWSQLIIPLEGIKNLEDSDPEYNCIWAEPVWTPEGTDGQ